MSNVVMTVKLSRWGRVAGFGAKQKEMIKSCMLR